MQQFVNITFGWKHGRLYLTGIVNAFNDLVPLRNDSVTLFLNLVALCPDLILLVGNLPGPLLYNSFKYLFFTFQTAGPQAYKSIQTQDECDDISPIGHT